MKKYLILFIALCILLVIVFIKAMQIDDTTNTISTNEVKNTEIIETKEVEKIKLKYKAQEFYEILCDVTGIEKIDTNNFVYANSNNNYAFEIVADENDDIKSIQLKAFNDEYTNFFMAIGRIFESYPENYSVNTIIDNLGKENIITFNNIDFVFSVEKNKPVLNVTIK